MISDKPINCIFFKFSKCFVSSIRSAASSKHSFAVQFMNLHSLDDKSLLHNVGLLRRSTRSFAHSWQKQSFKHKMYVGDIHQQGGILPLQLLALIFYSIHLFCVPRFYSLFSGQCFSSLFIALLCLSFIWFVYARVVLVFLCKTVFDGHRTHSSVIKPLENFRSHHAPINWLFYYFE